MAALRSDSMFLLFSRLFWIMLGPGILLLSTVTILSSQQTGWRTGADIAYFVALAGMLSGRYFEHRGGIPRTSTGEPATAGDLRRYAIVVAAGGISIWVLANVISNYVL